MTSNSLKEVLARMQGRPMTYGWGAIAAFSRTRLNEILAQQFAAALGKASVIPPFTTDLALDERGYITARLEAIVLGPGCRSTQPPSGTERRR